MCLFWCMLHCFIFSPLFEKVPRNDCTEKEEAQISIRPEFLPTILHVVQVNSVYLKKRKD